MPLGKDPAAAAASRMTAARRGIGVWWSRWHAWIEGAAAIALSANVLSSSFVIFGGMLIGFVRAVLYTPRLAAVDPPTIGVVAVATLKIALGFGPIVLWTARLPWQRRLWLIVPACGAMFIAIMGMGACLEPSRWVALIVLSALAFVTSRRRWLGVTALLPLPLFFEPSLAHMYGRQLWHHDELIVRCDRNDGTRPVNARPHYAPTYHAVTQVADDRLLLTSVGKNESRMSDRDDADPTLDYGSFWVKRGDDGTLSLAERSGATGNMWHGCLLNGTAWFSQYRVLIGARWLGGGDRDNYQYEQVDHVPVWSDDGDFDKPNTACDARRDAVYFADLLAGRLGQYSVASGEVRSFPLGGIAIQVVAARDGRVVAVDSARLSVFDPGSWTVTAQVPAGAANIHFARCQQDDAVTTADFVGRIREFVPDGAGSYSFAWGLSLPAPRRVAYSPDCRFIAVTSADDHSVFVVARDTHQVVRTFNVGPALREVVFIGPREIAAADACTIEQLVF